MRFSSYDALRLFDVVARQLNFTAAARELNLSKGAVSYRIARLEDDLGFPVFLRRHRGVVLSEKGKRLWHASQVAFDNIDREIAVLRAHAFDSITIGLSTYFASRWLSPRLMTFIVDHPDIALRLQPSNDLVDLRAQRIDMAIRWGKRQWHDVVIEPLLPLPAFATAGETLARRIEERGLRRSMPDLVLLHDRDDSEAWADWHRAADLAYSPARQGLVVPDPNVRVQAVIDGQGIALNDALVASELASGTLARISPVQLDDYGYFLAYPSGALDDPALSAFRNWIMRAGADAQNTGMNVASPVSPAG